MPVKICGSWSAWQCAFIIKQIKDLTSQRHVKIVSLLDLPQVYFVNKKNWKREKRNVSSFAVSSRLITDDEIDLGQVYQSPY